MIAIFSSRRFSCLWGSSLLLAACGSDPASTAASSGCPEGQNRDAAGVCVSGQASVDTNTGLFTLSVSQEPTGLRRGATAEIDVKVQRLNGFQGAIDLSIDGLAAGVTGVTAQVLAGADSVVLSLSAANSATPGNAVPATVKGVSGTTVVTAPIKVYVRGNPGEVDLTYPKGKTSAGNVQPVVEPFEVDSSIGGAYGLGIDGATADVDNDGIFVTGVQRRDSNTGSTFESSSVLQRLNEDGLYDSSFAGKGFVGFDFAGNDGYPKVARILDNKLMVVGTATKKAADGTEQTAYGALARFQFDGTADTSFGAATAGVLDTNAQLPTSASDLVTTKDGRIVFSNENRIYLLKPDGSLDESFGQKGVFQVASTDAIRSVIVAGDSIVAVGTRKISFREDVKNARIARGEPWFDPTIAVVYRISLSGELDASFGEAGVVTLPDTDDRSFRGVVFVKTDSKGNIYLRGFSGSSAKVLLSLIQPTKLGLCPVYPEPCSIGPTTGFDADFDAWFVSRLSPDGTIDSSFGNNGYALLSSSKIANRTHSPHLFMDSSDRPWLVVGTTYSSTSPDCKIDLRRFTTTGSVDSSFATVEDGAALINVDRNKLPNSQNCSMWVTATFPASLDRTTFVGSVVSDNRVRPFVARVWN